MKKEYQIDNKWWFIWPLGFIITYLVIVYPLFKEQPAFINTSIFLYSTAAWFLLTVIPPIVSKTAMLELEDGILVRKNLIFKFWAVSVTDITDIAQGAGQRRYTPEVGLLIKNKNNKYFRIPYIFVNQQELLSDLKAINPAIQYHAGNFVNGLFVGNDLVNGWGWRKGDSRNNITIIILAILVLGFVILKIISSFAN